MSRGGLWIHSTNVGGALFRTGAPCAALGTPFTHLFIHQSSDGLSLPIALERNADSSPWPTGAHTTWPQLRSLLFYPSLLPHAPLSTLASLSSSHTPHTLVTFTCRDEVFPPHPHPAATPTGQSENKRQLCDRASIGDCGSSEEGPNPGRLPGGSN